jgi:hypothetical protein
MYFITQLQESHGYSGIIVGVDRFSRYATFIPTKVLCQVEEVAKLFFKHIVKY